MAGETVMNEFLNLMTWELLAIAVMMVAIIILMFKLRRNINVEGALDHLINMTQQHFDTQLQFYDAVMERLDIIARKGAPAVKKEAVAKPAVAPPPQQPVAQPAVPAAQPQPRTPPSAGVLESRPELREPARPDTQQPQQKQPRWGSVQE